MLSLNSIGFSQFNFLYFNKIYNRKFAYFYFQLNVLSASLFLSSLVIIAMFKYIKVFTSDTKDYYNDEVCLFIILILFYKVIKIIS